MKRLPVILVGFHSSVREGADATITLRQRICLLAVGSPGTERQQLRNHFLADQQIFLRQQLPHSLQAVDLV